MATHCPGTTKSKCLGLPITTLCLLVKSNLLFCPYFPHTSYTPVKLKHSPHAFVPSCGSSPCPLHLEFIHSTHICEELTVPSAMSWDAFSSSSHIQILPIVVGPVQRSPHPWGHQIPLVRNGLSLLWPPTSSEHWWRSAFITVIWVNATSLPCLNPLRNSYHVQHCVLQGE